MTGQELRQVRIALALTQKEMAEKMGIKENTLAIKEMEDARLKVTMKDIQKLNVIMKTRLNEIIEAFGQVEVLLRKSAKELLK